MGESVHTVGELRAYLRQRKRSKTHVLQEDFESFIEFESFLKDVGDLFALRVAAEERWCGSPRDSIFGYDEHRHEAQNARGPLLLEWEDIKPILLPDKDQPRTTLISIIAAHCAEDVRVISAGLRRVLSRERISTPVGKVQMLDNYCMRWLMRQPGRSFEEKAGIQQRVMAVVRREQFDTLENRVFKDFLIRAENLAESYLEEIAPRFSDTQVYTTVRRFKLACQGALNLPEMELISSITSLPQPNYVLQQDNHYSKIWSAYCRIIRLSNLAEKLWNGREVFTRKLRVLAEEAQWQHEHRGHALLHTQIWIKPLDGDPDFTEYSCRHHDLADAATQQRREDRERILHFDGSAGVVDLSGNRTWGSCLVRGGFHANAQPRIEQEDYLLFDDLPQACKFHNLPPSRASHKISLSDIFPVLNRSSVGRKQDKAIATARCDSDSYCARLIGEMRAQNRAMDEVVVLAPDDWNAVTQEIVIRSFSRIERRKIHLLWRSVATALGCDACIQDHIEDGESVAIVDFRNDSTALVTNLKYFKDEKDNRLVPQRSVYLKNGAVNSVRYAVFSASEYDRILDCSPVRDAKVVCVSGAVPDSFRHKFDRLASPEDSPFSDSVVRRILHIGTRTKLLLEDRSDSWSQKDGALLFLRDRAIRNVYYDELETMWIVGQDEIHEKIVKDPLVPGKERFPGGTSQRVAVATGKLNIGAGQRGVEFLFHIGSITDHTPLHRYQQELTGTILHDSLPLDVEIEVSPGQGMALTTVMAPIFNQPILLDYLNNMELSDVTIAKKDDELERSFPPTTAIVEALDDPYAGGFFVRNDPTERLVRGFLDGRIKFQDIPADLFYQARNRQEADLRPGESRLHLLDRYNLFGNVEGALRPRWMSADDEDRLFKKVVDSLRINRSKALRLIAWTYRGSNKDVQGIARKIFSLWVSGRSPNVSGEMTLWRSLIGNLLVCDGLQDLLPTFIQRFIQIGDLYGCWDYQELRMFYYMLQFDQDFCEHAKLTCADATAIARVLCSSLRIYRKGGKSNTYPAALRCLLYLLRMREKERHFLRNYDKFSGPVPESIDVKVAMLQTFNEIDNELRMGMMDERPKTKSLRKITHKFLNGSGTLPDVISIVGDD